METTFRLASEEKPLVIVPVHVNGQGPYDFALDTGASMCLISRSLQESLGIPVQAEGEGMGAGGSVAASLGEVAELRVGGTSLGPLQVAILELDQLSQTLETALDGVVGYNFLAHFRLAVDYPRRTLRLEKEAGRVDVLLELAQNSMFIQGVHVNGQGPFTFMVSSDTPRSILDLAAAETLKVDLQEGDTGIGAGGPVETQRTRLASLEIPGLILEDVPAVVSDLSAIGQRLGRDFAGVIANDLLIRLEAVIDYRSRRLRLHPSA